MKVAQEIDVDNVTIIINPQNKLEAKIPTSTPTSVEIEEIDANLYFTLDKGLVVHRNDINMVYPLQKLGKIKGTEWLVIRPDESKATQRAKRTIDKNIRIEFYDDVGVDSGDGYSFNHTGKVRVITEDGSPFTLNDNPTHENYSDFRIEMEISGNTQKRIGTPTINLKTMTYEIFIAYGDPQTSSVLTNVTSNGANFTVEHDDAFYEYHVNSVAVVQNTPAQPVTEYDRTNLVGWTALGDDSIVTYIKDGNDIVGATTTISFESNLPAGMSFDVHFKLNEQPVKTVNVVSNGQSQFTVTTGVTDFRFDTSTGTTPSGCISIDNEKNNVANRERYNIMVSRAFWVGGMGRDF